MLPSYGTWTRDWRTRRRRAETLELVVVLRGTVHRRRGYPRPLWRVRLLDGHYRVVSAESIVAATPVKKEGIPHKAGRRVHLAIAEGSRAVCERSPSEPTSGLTRLGSSGSRAHVRRADGAVSSIVAARVTRMLLGWMPMTAGMPACSQSTWCWMR